MTVTAPSLLQFRASKAVPCSGCGRTVHREVYLQQESTRLEVPDSVLGSLAAEAETWQARPELCDTCKAVAS